MLQDELATLAEVLDPVPGPRRIQGPGRRIGALLALCRIAVLSGAGLADRHRPARR
ncbi:hypothetical protein HRW23_03570 [Streptomyces lunaelactis]|uniref:hypothetical protein n=1 Tax=Streptomyces lunaelactis TaxID=1535768 RepID=UPI001584C9CE|nr:hypothetical protein [Streptomyces lunaelactis]NUK02979.1 hypothetical protein [Streptomyces lunaelactis]NUK11121.1 hypothetical protein [Streptomyces lunaelactis]NUK18317.1 hypothetical protein [Streptomyces lunaelactis]NUK25280.1 hypothetical protein [Streptomyces lunaelactis]NUK37192.1 hypothetical protein [Streptomyces lunaelactis]